MSKFCSKCGAALTEGVKFCSSCGAATEQSSFSGAYQQYQPPYQQAYYAPPRNVVAEVSQRVKIDGIIWLVVACIQYLIGLLSVFSGYGIFVLIVAVLNTVGAIQDFKFSREVLSCPIGIVDKYKPIAGRILNLIYNIIFGGIIGIAGSIYGFVLRSFVVSNELQLMNIEQQYYEQQRQTSSSSTGTSDMRKCAKCGSIIRSDMGSCKFCGTPANYSVPFDRN